MVVNVISDKKIVEVWLTRTEKSDTCVRDSLKMLYAKYKPMKYTVAVFHSGKNDLYGNTLDLLKYNKKQIAELEVQREKTANG